MTLKEWLIIFLDLDAYIAKGGRLGDLPLPPLQNMPPEALDTIAERMGAERLDRIGRFYARLGVGATNASVGEEYTESELRAVWRETAASTKSLQS
jgi:hypothetical protein